MSKANLIFKECFWAILCISVILLNGCKLPELIKAKPAVARDKPLIEVSTTKEVPPVEEEDKAKKEIPPVEEDKTKTDKPAVNKDKPSVKESKEKEAPPADKGSGYLSKGSPLGLGLVVIDGDEEVSVFEKIKILETRLKALKNEMRIKTEKSNKKLADLQAAKEVVEKNFADTKERLEKENKDLSDKIESLESKQIDLEARAVSAENELNPVKDELLKTQLSEIKAQQELYKLKIENLKQDEEE
ncbi:MAG: hypothetical protein MAG551_01738 [Candidatus Scalindua arabica]|uniref:Uncharacterized protein n=1 Tax=Candidatus Scalindua arabica TaxID=1127984 RepID=A0A942A2V2_9BACT|nr:hypothetical protein [Candidatus Scalindua arabica]